MNTYDVYSPLAGQKLRDAIRVKSPDSFTARRDFAAMHPGMEVSDVVSVRVWTTEEKEPV
jgi:hypothetical protein